MFLGILLAVCVLNLVWPDREFSEKREPYAGAEAGA